MRIQAGFMALILTVVTLVIWLIRGALTAFFIKSDGSHNGFVLGGLLALVALAVWYMFLKFITHNQNRHGRN